MKITAKIYRDNNLDKVHAAQKKSIAKNREYYRSKTKIKNRILKAKILIGYGGENPSCECCGESRFEFLTLDHIWGDGRKHKKTAKHRIYWDLIKRNFPPGHRILCFNCNCSLGFYGHCPHTSKGIDILEISPKIQEFIEERRKRKPST